MEQTLKFGRAAVMINMLGILLSGLVFPVTSALFFPQPVWSGHEVFIQSFHPIQTATFFCGYFLVIGSLLTFAALYKIASEERKIYALAGFSINVVFTAVVFINYIIQTTYVPYLAINNPPETQFVLPVFSMSNPGSFAWALEMYGWGGIGLSFIFMAFVFGPLKTKRTLKTLFLINGVSSCVSAIMTSVNMNWLFTGAGFAALITWNLLVFIIDIYLLRYFSAILNKKLTQ